MTLFGANKDTQEETMEARLEEEEPASVEDAARMPVGEPRKRRRDRRH
jgi:hypothetical protein